MDSFSPRAGNTERKACRTKSEFETDEHRRKGVMACSQSVQQRGVRNLSSSEVYSIDQTNALVTERNKQDAIAVLAEKIAETTYDRLTENF
jgi:hypothetical protein